VPGLLAPVTGSFVTASLISASGDQDHTTWPSALEPLVWRPQHVHRIPHSTLLTMRSAPLIERGMRGEKHGFPKNGRDIFLREGLETPDRFESAREISFSAPAVWPPPTARPEPFDSKIGQAIREGQILAGRISRRRVLKSRPSG